MNVYLLPGVCGLLLGLLLHYTGFSRQGALRDTLALRRSHALRSGLYAVGAGMALTALLCWLAVVDVDEIVVLPLSLGVLVGGAVFGISAGICGYTPLTVFAGLGGGEAVGALCCAAGCTLGAWTLSMAEEWLEPLRTAEPFLAATLFQVTLDEPWVLGGSFLGQGCAGLVLMAAAICIPSPRRETVAEHAAEEQQLADAPEPEDAPQETFVALLPGEEPLVVDTAADEGASDDAEQEHAPMEEEPDDAEEPVEPELPEEDTPNGDEETEAAEPEQEKP